ncbi:MAG: hypothetical protein RL467_45, partial [Actinomycetota bacterium]
MKALIILSLALFFTVPEIAVAECTESACVDVYTKDNQIIIEAHKGSGGTTTVRAPKPQ